MRLLTRKSRKFTAAALSLALAAPLLGTAVPASMATTGDAALMAYAGSNPAGNPETDAPGVASGSNPGTGASATGAADASTAFGKNTVTSAGPEATTNSAVQPLSTVQPLVAADTVKPQLTGLTPADGSVTGPSATFSADYSDPAPSSGINTASAMIHIDNRHQYGCAVTDSRITCQKSGLTGGTHKIEAFICDKSWNCSIAAWYITVDATPPVIFAVQPTGIINTGTATIAAVFDDGAGSGIAPASAMATLDGTVANSACQISAAGVSCPVTGLADGDHTVRVEVSDQAGNRSRKDWSFSVDTATVGITGHEPAADSWITDSFPAIKANFQKAGAGVIDTAAIVVQLDDDDVSAAADRSVGGISFTPAGTPLSEGWHTASVAVRDDAGHSGFSQWRFAVDTIPPKITNEAPTGVATARPTIKARISDDGSGINQESLSLAIDGTDETGSTALSENTVTCVPADALAPGTHSAQLTVSDLAGNRQTLVWSFVVTAAPSVSVPVSAPASTAPWQQTLVEYWHGYTPFAAGGAGSWVISGFQAFPNTYHLPWYDGAATAAGLKDEIVIRNQGAGEAIVNIFVGSENKWQGKIPEGGVETREIPDTVGGPVKIICPTGQSLMVTHRLTNGGFASEAAAVADEALEPVLLLPWYESRPAGQGRTTLFIANAGGQEASVDVYVGDPAQPESLKGRYAIAPAAAARTELAAVHGGPVRIVCTNGQPLVAAVQESTGDSLSETLATGFSLLGDRYLLPPAPDAANAAAPAMLYLGNGNDKDLRVEIRADGRLLVDPDNPGNEYFTVPRHGALAVDTTAVRGQQLEIVCTDCILGEGLSVNMSPEQRRIAGE